MNAGIVAADTIINELDQGNDISRKDLTNFGKNVHDTPSANELRKWRNFKGGFKRNLWLGMIHGSLLRLTKGKEPWTILNKHTDSENTRPKNQFKPKVYPKKDGKLTFDLLTNLMRSGTNHDHDQPSHLKIRDGMEDWIEKSYDIYGSPEVNFCPAKVYELVKDEKSGKMKLQINAQN